jgi:dihydroxyacetone kinase-like predicted kinase
MPAGRGTVVVLDVLAEVVSGQPRPPWQEPVLARSCDLEQLRAQYRGPAYEVMYTLHASAAQVADVQSQLVNLGDSLAAVGSDGVWRACMSTWMTQRPRLRLVGRPVMCSAYRLHT